MQEFEFDVADFSKANAGDDKLFVVFYQSYVKDDTESEKQGRPVFRDETFIRIVSPGDRNNVVERPLRPDDPKRFPKQWAIYKQGEEQVGIGLRLEEWPLVSRAMVEELKFFNFRTVEHIAEAKDDVCSKMPGLRQLKDKATAYLQLAKDNAPLEQMQNELARRDATISALQAQVEELAKLIPTESKVAVPKK